MEKTQMMIRKKVEGQVAFNNGESAEVEINGIEGPEKGLFLETIQIHPEETDMSPEDFQQRFPVGMLLDISTVTEITHRDKPLTAYEKSNAWKHSRQ